jgi:hypothetical protein
MLVYCPCRVQKWAHHTAAELHLMKDSLPSATLHMLPCDCQVNPSHPPVRLQVLTPCLPATPAPPTPQSQSPHARDRQQAS